MLLCFTTHFIGGYHTKLEPFPAFLVIFRQEEVTIMNKVSLRIDKGSRALRCIIARSGVTIPSTVTFEIPPESSYFPLSSDVSYIIFGPELWK